MIWMMVFTETEDVLSTTGTVGVPIKINQEILMILIQQILDILSTKLWQIRRTNGLIILLKNAKEADIIDVIDICEKFNFDNFKLMNVRSYDKLERLKIIDLNLIKIIIN